jgi:hypothetical protein
MRQRSLFTGLLLLALLLSAWGNVLAAAFCPCMPQGHACCHARRAAQHAAHNEMADMQMGDDESLPVTEQPPVANDFISPVAPCEHCLSHSQGVTAPATLREAEQTKRSADVTPVLPPAGPSSIAAAPVRAIMAREHAPPGANPERHVLISVFRI